MVSTLRVVYHYFPVEIYFQYSFGYYYKECIYTYNQTFIYVIWYSIYTMLFANYAPLKMNWLNKHCCNFFVGLALSILTENFSCWSFTILHKQEFRCYCSGYKVIFKSKVALTWQLFEIQQTMSDLLFGY